MYCQGRKPEEWGDGLHEQGTDDRYSSVMPKKWGSSERVR